MRICNEMRIVSVTQFFSKGSGYTENMLPKFLSKLGHEVLVLTSDLHGTATH